MENLGLRGSLLDFIAFKIFMPATVHYPNGRSILQVRGQLMGNPLSFPLLCIINLACYMRYRSIETKTQLMLSPFIINGDDIVFRAKFDEKEAWRDCVRGVGFSLNMLKTYSSKNFACVNSILFETKGWRIIRYFNQALAKCKRVKSEPIRMLSTASAIWSWLHRDLPQRVSKRGRRLLLESLRPRMEKFARGAFWPNFFLSKEVGGLGLENVKQERFKISRDQRKVATCLMQHPERSWLLEKVGSATRSSKVAMHTFLRIRPAVERRTFIGPLIPKDDYLVWYDFYLTEACKNALWIENHQADEVDVLRMIFRNAVSFKGTLAKTKKILTFKCRWILTGVQKKEVNDDLGYYGRKCRDFGPLLNRHLQSLT